MAREDRVAEILGAWYEARDTGHPLDPEALIRAHPDLAEDLRLHFRLMDAVGAAFPAEGAAEVRAPDAIGPYRIVAELGSGGMGTVYRAEVSRRTSGLDVGAAVALKVIHPHLLRTPGFFKRFLREAELGRRVEHANVVRTFDADALETDEGTRHFLVMEYVEGQTLRALLAELDRVPEDLCRHVGREVAKALAAIHRAGAVHRDLKPENVLITKDHAVKVMDLGVARLAEETPRLSQTGAFVGSLAYAAPEQFTGGAGRIDARSDLHALGVLLYELATGRHPFGDDDARAVMRRILTEEPRRLGEVNPQVSAFFEETVHMLLAKEPEKRFADATALLDVLEAGETSPWWKDRARAIRATTKRPLRRIRIPRETALYGREAELAALQALWEKARSGEGNVLLVEGEAGIGKSRLVDEFVGLLQRQGEDLNFLFGSYPPGGAATASGAFSTAYREQFGDAGLASYLPQTPLLVPAFDALLRGDAAPPGSEPLTKASLQTVFVHATRNLAAERPTIVLIEDLHFAPEEGRALFAALSLAVPGHRLLLVGTMRPGVSERWTSQIERMGHTQRLALSRLGIKDLVRLLQDALRSAHLAEELAGKIGLKSDGNPFFVFEILRGLKEGQFLAQRPDGTWHTTQVLRDIRVPSSITDLVQARVGDLDDDDRNLLDLASCVGFEFDPALVARASGIADVPTLQRLAKIEKRRRLVRASGRRFVFDHHQVREALYAALPEALRESYHAAIAEALEEMSGATGEGTGLDGALCVELTEHYLNGAKGARALRTIPTALAHCESSYLHEDAIRIVEKSLASPGLLAGSARVDALLRSSVLHSRLGRDAPGQAACEAAMALSREIGDRGREAAAMVNLAAHRTVQQERAVELCETAIDVAREIGDTALEYKARTNLGLALAHLGRLEEARGQHERVVEMARAAGDAEGEARGLLNLGAVCRDLELPEEAIDACRRSLDIARRHGSRLLEAQATGNLGCVYRLLGHVERAREETDSGLALARAVGDRHTEVAALINLGHDFYSLGRFGESVERHERGLALASEIGARHFCANATLALGNDCAALGRYAEAVGHLDAALALARELAYPLSEVFALANLAVCAVVLGDPRRGRDLANDSIALCRRMGSRSAEPFALDALANASLELGETSEAERTAQELVTLCRELGHEGEASGALLISASSHARAGNPGLAREEATEALEIARKHARPYAEVLASALLATLPGGDATAAAAVLAQHESHTQACVAMESRFLLWRATRDPVHLTEAKRRLDFMVEHAPPESRSSMLENVRLHREIMEAWAAQGAVAPT